MKKIICTVTNELVYDQRMQRICSSLQKHTFDVTLVGRATASSIPLSNRLFAQTRLRCFFNKGFLFYAEYNIRLFIFLMFTTFDIVCGCDLDTLPAAVLAAKIKRKKVVYDAHEYFPESPELIGRPMVKSVWHFIEKSLIKKADLVYTVTASIAQYFQRKYKIEVHVIRNVPIKSKVEKSKNQHQKIILYQGAVNIGRGLNELLLTMLKIKDAVCWIVGDGDEMQHIKQSIQELALGDKVKLLGKKKPEELRRITQDAYIGINLLENRGLSYYYSLGNKTFDYIHAAKPQVLIGFPEYIQLNNQYHIGLVVDELNIEKIQLAIEQLLQDDTLYKNIQQNCLRAKKELCWELEEQKLIALYKSLN